MPLNRQRIVYEDDDLLAVAKLSGELVVKGAGKVEKLPLLDFLKKEYPGLHPVNRLDFDTSGIVLFAKNREILKKIIDTDFADFIKTYRALVFGEIRRKGGVVHFPLPSRVTNEKVEAKTLYRVLAVFPNVTYVEADIETGRHHQIRKHFAMLSHPLVLDSVYGNADLNKKFSRKFHYQKFFLHALSMTFPHPRTGKTVRIEAPMPKAFEEILSKLAALSE